MSYRKDVGEVNAPVTVPPPRTYLLLRSPSLSVRRIPARVAHGLGRRFRRPACRSPPIADRRDCQQDSPHKEPRVPDPDVPA